MRPAFSVVFLTTLIGAGQGLFVALFAADVAGVGAPREFFVRGIVAVVALAAGGLIASFFHLGRPERAWRAAAKWKTSWLSREVIALPLFMAAVVAYGALHYLGHDGTRAAGAIGVALCLALFVCTGMIYACIRFLQEWATPLTVINYLMLGTASGLTLAAAFRALVAPERAAAYASGALAATLAALVTRCITLLRNARLRHVSSLQTA